MPAKRGVCTPPSLPTQLEEIAAFDLVERESVDDVLVSGADLAGSRAPGCGIRSSRLAGVMLQSCELQRLDARDVVFENCDLSGSIFPRRALSVWSSSVAASRVPCSP